MDSCLCQMIPVSLPKWQPYTQVPEIPGYTQVSSLTPVLGKLLGAKPEQEGQFSGGNLFFKVSDFEGSGSCSVQLIGKKGKKKAFCKVTHLLDPVRTIQAYYTHPEKGERRRQAKLNNPVNQAYVDALANYILGQIREKNVSPHFCLFYGGFQAIANEYRYDITDEFESYRKYKGFWSKRRGGLFDIVIDADSDSEIPEDFEALKHTPTSTLRSTPFSYFSHRSRLTSESTKSSASHISLDGEAGGATGPEVELESVKDEEIQSATTSSTSISEDSDTSEEEGGVSVYAKFKDYPVMLIFQEEMEGVLDDLLEEDHDENMEEQWTAWTFQIIAAVCVMQGVLGMTHNDLHTNNIVFIETDQPWIFYKLRDGTVFRVPTFGKLFRIIDFGRAIFRIENNWFVSDDYEKGGDAEGQYRFDHLRKEGVEDVYPNPSFDLCRYAVSVIEALFPEMPTEKLDGGVLSQEEDWVIHETESPLWNLLWSWMVDDNGANVLINKDGSERFPDFDLYQQIGAFVHGAKPHEQVLKPIFSEYKIAAKDVGEWETVYPLFC